MLGWLPFRLHLSRLDLGSSSTRSKLHLIGIFSWLLFGSQSEMEILPRVFVLKSQDLFGLVQFCCSLCWRMISKAGVISKFTSVLFYLNSAPRQLMLSCTNCLLVMILTVQKWMHLPSSQKFIPLIPNRGINLWMQTGHFRFRRLKQIEQSRSELSSKEK